VKRILVRGGAAYGVVVETGHARARREQEVHAGVVVSNADMRQTVESLLVPECPPELLAAVRRLRPSYPCFLTHIGVRDVPAEVLRRVHGYHWQGWDPDRVGEGALRCKLFVPTLYDPSLAPPGGHIVIAQKVMAVDFSSVADWAAHKAAVEQGILDHVERLIPGFRERIVVKLSATAETSRRFTWNHQGAMLGWEMAPDQLGADRPDVHGAVRGLYFTGHWTRPGGGITPVLVSAMNVAELIVRGGESTPRSEATPEPALV
jgi:prolycopene isomerase